MSDKYSFKDRENTNNLAKYIRKHLWNVKRIMENNPEHNQTPEETNIKKSTKTQQKSLTNTSRQASGPSKGSKRAKMAQKEIGPKTLGVPSDPLGEPKITKKAKNMESKNR